MKRRLVLGLLVALCALPAAGCGGGSAAGEGAAGIVPATVPVYVSLNTDFEGDQIQQAEQLLDRFPGSSGLLGMAESELEAEGDLDFQQDIRPALGPTLDVAVLELPREDSSAASAVVLLKPDDPAKLDALLEQSEADSRPVKTEVDGWTVLAEDQETLDRFEAGRDGDSLEDSDAYGDAMEGLPEHALVRAFVAPDALTSALPQEGMTGVPQLEQLFGVGGTGMAVTAEDRGFAVEAAAITEQELSGSFEPELPSELPAGAFAYLGFGDLATAVREGLNTAGEQNPQLDQQIAQLEFALGLSLDEDILPLLEQETALALYPGEAGAELPSFLLALKVDDGAQALATVDRIVERARALSPEVPEAVPSQVGGAEVRELILADGTRILYGSFEGMLFATNDAAVVTQLTGDAARLAEDDAFMDARELADVPDEVESLIYVDLDSGVDYGLSLAKRTGEPVPSQVRENVEPLASFVLYSTRDGDRSRGAGFLALDE